jgi:hypothetical protein
LVASLTLYRLQNTFFCGFNICHSTSDLDLNFRGLF